MLYNNGFLWIVILLIIHKAYAPSFNQPKICPNSVWNPNATTLANQDIIGVKPHSVFVDVNNTVFLAPHRKKYILVRPEKGTPFELNLNVQTNEYPNLFVSTDGIVYFQGEQQGKIHKWIKSSNTSELVKDFTGHCYGLFIDTNNTLYCCIQNQQRVVSSLLTDKNSHLTVNAGTGTPGSLSHELRQPCGIFVDANFDLYVADTHNNRIQRFRAGQKNGTTVVGTDTSSNLTLNRPTGVVLGADHYLFIIDSEHDRVVRVGFSTFECIVGCTNSRGRASDQLQMPYGIHFDSYGNIYVADTENDRIQKFDLMTNCGETSTIKYTITSSFAWEKQSESKTTAGEMMRTEQTNTISILISKVLTTSISTTVTETQNKPMTTTPSPPRPPDIFHPECPNSTFIGPTCDIPNEPCCRLDPCLNDGNCSNNSTAPDGYSCLCPLGFNGRQCESDDRVCKPGICRNNGTCNDPLNATSPCLCKDGWTGIYCETKFDYCFNVTCENRGVCRSLLLDYTCQCLGDSYSGRHCEIVATKMVIYQIVSKSFAYIAIIAMLSVAMFVVIMDILKYCFGIDPVDEERERMRREKLAKKRKPVIQRFVYVHGPSATKQQDSTTR